MKIDPLPATLPDLPPVATGRGWLRRMPLIVILCAAALGAVLLRDQISFDSLARHQDRLLAYRDAHYLLAALGFMLAYVMIAAFSLPGASIATLTGGYLFGLFPGAVFNVLAAGTGAVLVFLAARSGFGAALSDRMLKGGGAAARMARQLEENEWSVLFLMRLVPAVPFFIANLIPALIGTSLWRFAVSTYLGIIPGAVVYTSVGAGLGEVFARGDAPDFGLLFTPAILGPILGLAALAALPIVLKARQKGA